MQCQKNHTPLNLQGLEAALEVLLGQPLQEETGEKAGDPRLIRLTSGLFTIVDAIYFDRLNGHNWFALRSGTGPIYAARHARISGIANTILMHRQILEAPDGLLTDHVNGYSLDNRKCNLRLATNTQNQRGFKRKAFNTTSRFRGVCFNKKLQKWIAAISVNKKTMHLGCFNSEEDAANCYDLAAVNHFKDFAQPNIRNSGPT